MEDETPGRNEEEIELKERDNDREYRRPIDWYTQIDKNKPFTWKPNEQKYKSPFFNEFNPRQVFDKRTIHNKTVRKSAIRNFISSPFEIDEKAQYFKDLNVRKGRYDKKSSRFVLEFTYKGTPIKYYDPTTNIFSHENKYMEEFVKDVQAYHGLKSVEEVKPQIRSIMTDEKPKENLTSPSRPPTPPKPSKDKYTPQSSEPTVLKNVWDSLSSVVNRGSGWFTNKADENLKKTSDESSKLTTEAYLTEEIQRLNNEAKNYKRVNNENQQQIDNMNEKIRQQIKTIGDRDIEIMNLKQQISSTNENNEDINQEIEKKNYELRQMKTNLENLKAERDRIKKSFEKDIQDKNSQIQELRDNLELTGSQILRRDEEIKMLQNKLEKTEEYVKRYPQEKAKYEDTITEMKNKLKTEKSDHKKLRDSYDAIKSELGEKNKSFDDQLSKKLESIQSLLESEKGKVKDLKQSKKELEIRNRDLVENFNSLDSIYEANKTYLITLESDKREVISKLENLQDEYQRTLRGKDLSDERVLELQQENESIQRELQDEKDSYSKLLKSRDSFEKKYRDLKQKFNDHQLQTNQYSKSMQQELDNSRVAKGEYEELKQERDELIEKTQELNRKLETYQLSLEAVGKKNKLDVERQLQKLKDSNERLQDLQKRLDAKEIDVQKFKRLFRENENKYKILKNSTDKIINSKSNNVKELLEKNEAQETRIQELEEIEEHYIERVKVKNAEVQEQIDIVKEKEQLIDSLVSKVSLQDVYKDQFNEMKRRHENTTREYHRTLNERNQYISDLSGNETKRVTLEKELADLQKELDSQKLEMGNLQKKMIDPQEFEETRNHVRELSDELNKKEDALHDKEVEANHYRQETEDLREYIRSQKQKIESEMNEQRERYEQRIAKREKEFANQLKNYIKPGEIRAINLGLEKLDAIEVKKYSDEEFEKVMKELRTLRDRNRRIAENPSESSSKRRKYDRLRKNVDYKIDLINQENGKAIETSQGKDIVLEDKKGVLGALHRLTRRFWETGVKYLGVIGSIVSIIGTAFYLFCLATGRTALQGAKALSNLVNDAALNIPADVLNGLLEGSKLIIHYGKKTLVIAFLVVISFVLLYRAYISPNQTEFLISFLLVGGIIGGGYWYVNYD